MPRMCCKATVNNTEKKPLLIEDGVKLLILPVNLSMTPCKVDIYSVVES